VQVCREQDARLVRVGRDVRVEAELRNGATAVSIETARRRLEQVPLALAGRHQAQNAAVAVAVLDELERAGIAVGDDEIETGLRTVRWPARLERFRRDGCEILLDAAHNPDGARVLAAYLRELDWPAVTLVFGAMRDKDVRGMLLELLPLCRRVICTTAAGKRALTAGEIREMAAGLGTPASVEAIAEPERALQAACGTGGPVVAAGSIFLTGPLRDILR
jgi:dihydrofolate synthase/folylpolyglutamate synthase